MDRQSAIQVASGVLPVLLAASAASAGVHFVNASAIGVKNGNSWATAYSDLQGAIAEAVNGDEIWVAKGTYKPTTGSSRTAAFNLKNGVRFRGGFTVGDNDVDDADPAANPTILSGEIGVAGSADNSLHVVKALSISSGLLDGFTITGGNANLAGDDQGGGIEMIGAGSFAIRRCTFSNNTATGGGGAIVAIAFSGALSECLFIANLSSGGAGGAIEMQQGSPQFVNCRFINNSVTNSSTGGGIRILNAGSAGSPVRIHNCLFENNSSGAGGGGFSITSGHAEVIECTVVDNTSLSESGGGIRIAGSATVLLSNNIVYGNVGATGSLEAFQINVSSSTVNDSFNCIEGLNRSALLVGAGNFDLNPEFVDADGINGIPGDLDDDYSLRAISPCVDAGNGAQLSDDLGDADGDGVTSELLLLDLDGNFRFFNDVRPDAGAGATTFIDLGAYEFIRDYRIYFVNHAAPPGQGGSSWDDAYSTIQEALFAVSDVESNGPGEIWVVEGTYLTTTTGDRTKSFLLADGALLFGGFAGNEVSRSQRNFIEHPTILSGEINTPGGKDNALHVLSATGSFIDECLVDGFIVTRSFCDGGTGLLAGGGLRIDAGAAVTVRNCRFMDNHAANGAGGGGAGVVGTGFFANCTFTGNTATDFGGAMFLAPQSFVILSNCTVTGNTSKFGAGGVTVAGNGNATMQVQNSILFGNASATQTGQDEQFTISNGSLSRFNCCIQCKEPDSAVLLNFGNPPRFVDADGPDDNFGTIDDDVRLQSFSPCIDKGKPGLFVADTFDNDDDGVVSEFLANDGGLLSRFVDDAGIDDGIGNPSHIDVGATEFQESSEGLEPILGDLNDDGVVDGADLGLLLGSWDTNDPIADLDFSCNVDGADLGLLLGNWS